jgi:hypothetical protein
MKARRFRRNDITFDKSSRTSAFAAATSKNGRNSGRGGDATAVLLTTSTSANNCHAIWFRSSPVASAHVGQVLGEDASRVVGRVGFGGQRRQFP